MSNSNRDRSNDVFITGATFIGCTAMGEPIWDTSAGPRDLGNGNVAFPAGWTREMAAQWRRENNIPGNGWNPAQTQH